MPRSLPPPVPPRPEVLAFLNDCKENPDDDTPRLVLADWLEDHGDERGEFVRLQCLRAARQANPANRDEPGGREAELLARHREAWLGYLAEKGIRSEFRRGLVSAWGGTRKLLSKRLAAMPVCERLAWVDYLYLYDFQAEQLPLLASSPHWTVLTKLTLAKSGGYFADQLVDPATIGSSPEDWGPLTSVALLTRLTQLDLPCQDLGVAGASVLANLPELKLLRALSLYGNNLGDEGAAAFTACRSLTGLSNLDLSHNRIRADGFAALATWPGLATVTELSLESNYPGPEGVAALSASPWLGNVTRLRLEAVEHGLPAWFGPTAFGPEGVASLAAARGLSRLRQLRLGGNLIGPEGAEAFAASKAFPALIELDLSANEIGDAGAAALAKSRLLRGLTKLDLRYNQIGDRGAEALVRSSHLSKLTELNFRANWDASPRALALLQDRFGDVVDVGEIRHPFGG